MNQGWFGELNDGCQWGCKLFAIATGINLESGVRKTIMNNLMIASSDQDRLALWKQGLTGNVSTALIKDKLLGNKLNALTEDMVKIKPQILLLDFDLLGLDGSYSVVSLRRLCAETKIIIMSGDISEDMEWELLKAGMRGCCRYDVTHELLNQVVEAVHKGELWIPRTLTSRLIDELGNSTTLKNSANRATLGLLSKLTQREYDIAVRVGKGECNKQIALACNITERTVKAHLTEIFHKMGVTDRLNLALALAADNRITSEYSYSSLSAGYDQPELSRLRRLVV
jgi:two-component system NarL family response regulator